MFKKILSLCKKYKEIILYCIIGGLTTLINIAVFWVLHNPLKVATVPSNVIAWLISVIFAYITNKLFVFESKSFEFKVLLKEIISFFAFRILSGVLDTAIIWFTVDKMGWNDLLWKIISNVIVIVLNYIASKLFIFKKQKQPSTPNNPSTVQAEDNQNSQN